MLEEIKKIVANFANISIDQLSEETNFIELGIDSLTLLKIVMDVENVFDVHFEDEEIVDIRTILDISNIVVKKISWKFFKK